MSDERFKNLRREYLETPVPDFLIYDGWVNVRLKLTPRSYSFVRLFAGRFVMAVLILSLIFTVAVTSSQAAAPGDFLYPVKVASQNVYSRISGDVKSPIENRIQDVIDSIAEPDENLDEAIKHYENTITNSKNRIRSEELKEQFKATLVQQEDKLKHLNEQNDSEKRREMISELIDRTSEVRGEVKGEKETGDKHEQEETRGPRD